MVKKILLVEDELSVVEFIKKGLEELDYQVTVAIDGEMALDLVNQSSFDLFILDIMLPKINGLDVCKELRNRNIQAPILILTALGTSENVALGLNIGADDYLVKPFKFIELQARINALSRRLNFLEKTTFETNSENTYQLGDLLVNDDKKTVHKSNVEIVLTATEYRLLLALIKNKGKVLSRADLLESAWDIHFNMGTNVVDVYINYLRKKLDSQSDNKLIHTIVGMGYVMKEK